MGPRALTFLSRGCSGKVWAQMTDDQLRKTCPLLHATLLLEEAAFLVGHTRFP